MRVLAPVCSVVSSICRTSVPSQVNPHQPSFHLVAMPKQNKAAVVEKIKQHGEEPPKQWTKEQLLARLAELEPSPDKEQPGVVGTLREQYNKAKKTKANLQNLCAERAGGEDHRQRDDGDPPQPRRGGGHHADPCHRGGCDGIRQIRIGDDAQAETWIPEGFMTSPEEQFPGPKVQHRSEEFLRLPPRS